MDLLSDTFLSYVGEARNTLAVRGPTLEGRDLSLTRAELGQLVAKFVAEFRARCLGEGDRIVIALANSVEFVAAFWATMMIGAIAVPAPAPEERDAEQSRAVRRIAGICRACDPRCLLVANAAISARIRSAGVGCPSFGFDEFTLSKWDPLTRDNAADPGRLALLQFTSGSTGDPKACALTHAALMDNARAIIDRTGAVPLDAGICWLPLFHDMGLMIGVIAPTMNGGGSAWLSSPMRLLLNPFSWLDALSSAGACHTAVPNFIFDQILRRAGSGRLDRFDLRHVQTIICGAEPINYQLAHRFLDQLASSSHLCPEAFHAAYGMSEVTVMATSRRGGLAADPSPPHDGGSSNGSPRSIVNLGTTTPGTKLRIVDASGSAAGDRVVGEVQLQSTSMMSGYYRNEAATRAAFDGMWLRTGDLGYVVSGDLYLVGRAKETIIISGQNIYPTDIELEVADALDISASNIVAYGADGGAGTEEIHIVVEMRNPDAGPSVREISMRACMDACGLAPRSVTAVRLGAIPRTTSGKVCREELRKMSAPIGRSGPELTR